MRILISIMFNNPKIWSFSKQWIIAISAQFRRYLEIISRRPRFSARKIPKFVQKSRSLAMNGL